MNKRSYTPGEVAIELGIATKTVYRAIRSGELVAYEFNDKTIRIYSEGLEAWLLRCRARAVSRAGTSSSTEKNCELRTAEIQPHSEHETEQTSHAA